MQVAILGLSLYLLGIAFAPVITPHLSERLGRQFVYLLSLPLFSLFVLGASFSKSFAALAVCRFFAGFFGGPCLVLIEGTFADVWSAKITVAYYAVLASASFIGAATGKHLLIKILGIVIYSCPSRTTCWWLPLCLWGLAMDSMDCAYPCPSHLPLWDCHAGHIPKVRKKATLVRTLS